MQSRASFNNNNTYVNINGMFFLISSRIKKEEYAVCNEFTKTNTWRISSLNTVRQCVCRRKMTLSKKIVISIDAEIEFG